MVSEASIADALSALELAAAKGDGLPDQQIAENQEEGNLLPLLLLGFAQQYHTSWKQRLFEWQWERKRELARQRQHWECSEPKLHVLRQDGNKRVGNGLRHHRMSPMAANRSYRFPTQGRPEHGLST